MEKHQAQQFAQEWVSAWNAHDLDKILSHYEEEFEMSSPAITKLTGESSGVLRGKDAVGEYWSGALEKYPDLAKLIGKSLYPYEDSQNPDIDRVGPMMRAGTDPFA